MRGSFFDYYPVLTTKFTDNDDIIEVWHDREHKPMVLMDVTTGTPILSVSVVGLGIPQPFSMDRVPVFGQDYPLPATEPGRVLMTKRKNGAFQCIFEKDKMPFTFRVTNLTQFDISFFIRKGNNDVKGSPINKINLIERWKTIEIASDYSNGEREMIVSTLDEKVTVAQDENRAEGQAAQGSYFTILAYPTDAKADWTKAVWMCPDYVCIPPKKPELGGGGWGSVDRGTWNVATWSSGSGGANFSGGFSGGGGGFGVSALDAPNPSSSPSFGAELAYAGGFGGFGDDDAYAARVEHGDVRVQNTRTVQCNVFYKMGSAPVTLCLSVLMGDRVHMFPQIPVELQRRLMLECVNTYVQDKNKHLLAMVEHTFKEEECCICKNAPPQRIFVKCGHFAICNDCDTILQERKCPLCRAFIEASIKYI